MFQGVWPWFGFFEEFVPFWRPVVFVLEFAYLYWIVRSLLQVLKVETMHPGWKLYWEAVIYLLPVFGPLIALE